MLSMRNCRALQWHTPFLLTRMRSNVVGLRCVPFSATEAEIAAFFKGLELGVDGVVICVNFQGRSSGHAFVQFASPDIANRALDFNRQYMGGRYIEVFKGHPADMQGALRMVGRGSVNGVGSGSVTNTGIPGMAGNPDLRYTGVIRMRGLPYRCTSADITAFFTGLQIVPDGIFLCTHADGRPNGEAFVEFINEEMAALAHKLHKELIGRRYVFIHRSTKGDMLTAIQQRMYALFAGLEGFSLVSGHQAFAGMNLAAIQGAGLGISVLQGVGDLSAVACLKLKGLPFSAHPKDVGNFFDGYRIAPNGIHILNGPGDTPIGQAFVEFVSADEAQRAMERHGHLMGPRYVELFRATKCEMMIALGGLPGFNMSQPLDPSIQLLLLQKQAATGAFGMGGLISGQGVAWTPVQATNLYQQQNGPAAGAPATFDHSSGGGTMRAPYQ